MKKLILLSLISLAMTTTASAKTPSACLNAGGVRSTLGLDKGLYRICGFSNVIFVGDNDYEGYKAGYKIQSIEAFLNAKQDCGGLQNIPEACKKAGGSTVADRQGENYCVFKDGSVVQGRTLCMGSAGLDHLAGGSPFQI